MKSGKAVVIFLVLLTACATPYKPVGFMGGYSEMQVAENTFRVSFRGNGYTSKQRVSDFALLRAAVVTQRHGYSYFTIFDNDDYSEAGIISTPDYAMIVKKYGLSYTIVCYHSKPNVSGAVYEAEYIVKAMQKSYNINK